MGQRPRALISIHPPKYRNDAEWGWARLGSNFGAIDFAKSISLKPAFFSKWFLTNERTLPLATELVSAGAVHSQFGITALMATSSARYHDSIFLMAM